MPDVAAIIEKLLRLLLNGLDDLTSVVAPDYEGRNRRRVRWLLGLGFVIAFVILFELFEIQTKYFYFLTLDHRLKVLQELNDLAKNGVPSQPDLVPIYKQIANDLLVNGRVYTMNLNFISAFLSGFWTPLLPVKFVAGALLGIILVFVTFLSRMNKSDRQHMLRGALLVTYISGVVGACIPYDTARSLLANFLLYASIFLGVQVILLTTMGRRSLDSKAASTAAESSKNPAVG